MPKFDTSNPSTIHKSLVNKSQQVKEAFCKAANAASDKGMNITASVKQGLQAAEEVLSRELLAKQEELLKQQQVNKAKEALKISLEKQKALQEQQHRLALNKALENLSDDEDEEDLEEISKVLLQQPKAVKSTEFDKQGRLVTIFEDGTRVISKNAAPADKIDQTVAVQINPVFDYVQMNTTANLTSEDFVPGMLTWNSFEDCLDVVQNDGTRTQVGLENYIEVVNKSSSTYANGAVVMFSSVNGDEIPAVSLMQASGTTEPLLIVGVLTNELSPSERGRATVLGKVRDIDTTGTSVGETWQQGDLLWVHPSIPGAMTKIRPTAPNPAISVAAVLKVSATDGRILVRPTIFPRLFYGKFKSSTVQQPLAIDTPYAVAFETAEISAGVDMLDSTRVRCSANGLYSFDFRLQVTSTNSSQKTIYIWSRINGVDVPSTTTKVSLAGNAFEVIPSWNFVHTMQAGDYFQLMYATSDIAVLINAPASTAFCPATPSAVLKVNQVNL